MCKSCQYRMNFSKKSLKYSVNMERAPHQLVSYIHSLIHWFQSCSKYKINLFLKYLQEINNLLYISFYGWDKMRWDGVGYFDMRCCHPFVQVLSNDICKRIETNHRFYNCSVYMHVCMHLWSSPFSQMMSIQVNGREDLIDCNIVYKIVINVIYTYNKYNTRD